MRSPVTEASKGWQFCTTCLSLRDLHNPDTSTIGYEFRASTLTHAHSEQRCEANPPACGVLAMSTKTAIGGFDGDWGRWLALASLLISRIASPEMEGTGRDRSHPVGPAGIGLRVHGSHAGKLRARAWA